MELPTVSVSSAWPPSALPGAPVPALNTVLHHDCMTFSWNHSASSQGQECAHPEATVSLLSSVTRLLGSQMSLRYYLLSQPSLFLKLLSPRLQCVLCRRQWEVGGWSGYFLSFGLPW